jgi:hypothetical protein
MIFLSNFRIKTFLEKTQRFFKSVRTENKEWLEKGASEHS